MPMHPLHTYLNIYASTLISEEDFEIIKSHFTSRKIRKRQYFLEEGGICKHFAFIVKGAMRQYTVDEKGVEHIVQLSIENWWVGDRESWIMLTPSNYNIDAWEDTELLLITRADTLLLTTQCSPFNEMVRAMDERNNIATQKRITSSISFTAEKRYADFVNSHPDFLQRFPQHLIASYLGITKDTLSRVRKKPLKK
jgi:CRP-like cAMP-binding protein